jgi:hypothetical protein
MLSSSPFTMISLKISYRLLTMSMVQSILEPFAFTSVKQQKVQKLIEERESMLTDEHVCHFQIFPMNDTDILDTPVRKYHG